MSRSKCFLLFLLLNLLLGFAQAEEKTFLPENLSGLTNSAESDSVKIYYDLIAEENLNSRYGQNIAGMVVGGIFTGAGGTLTGFGLYEILKDSKSENFDDVADGILGGYCLFFGVPLFIVGIPVVLYNTYKFIVRKGHANQRDEYEEALKRYKLRQESSVEWTLLPVVNLANAGGGLNLLMAF